MIAEAHHWQLDGLPLRDKDSESPLTALAFAPDGNWIVLRSTHALTFYRAADLLAGNWREAGRVSLAGLGEPQGEGVTFAANDVVHLMSEGGSKKKPGAFAGLTCTLKP